MALIKCPNCGLDVSEKATTCVHCGASLSSKNDFTVKKCPECGTVLEDSAKVCPSCGYPIDEADISPSIDEAHSSASPLQSEQHKFSPSSLSLSSLKQLPKQIIVSILIFLVLIVIFIAYKSVPKKNPFFYELSPDTSYESALTILQSEYKDDGVFYDKSERKYIFVTCEDYLGNEDITGQIAYQFSGGIFSSVTVQVMTSDDSGDTDEDVGKFLNDKISSVYGKGTESSSGYSCSWDTKKYYITKDYMFGQLYNIRYCISFIPQ